MRKKLIFVHNKSSNKDLPKNFRGDALDTLPVSDHCSWNGLFTLW